MQSERKAAEPRPENVPNRAESFRDIVEWLLGMEARAAGIYVRLAEAFGADAEFRDLLTSLSKDEDEHYAALKKVFERIGKGLQPLLRMDGAARKEAEEKFRRVEESLAKGLSEEDALDFIVDIEFSEFNSLFLYAAAALDRSEFVPVATVKIRRHKKRVENFLRSRGLTARIESMKNLPELWREKILIVDDEDMISHAVQSVFENECLVANARDGATALKMVNEAYYSVIITDIGLPVMSGIEFYKRASVAYPSIRERVLFFTGWTDENTLSFLLENNLSYITKPVGIREIKKAVVEKLTR